MRGPGRQPVSRTSRHASAASGGRCDDGATGLFPPPAPLMRSPCSPVFERSTREDAGLRTEDGRGLANPLARRPFDKLSPRSSILRLRLPRPYYRPLGRRRHTHTPLPYILTARTNSRTCSTLVLN